MWEATTGSAARRTYSFGGAVIAQRDGSGPLTYLHGDHLGSISVLTNATGTVAPGGKQEFDPWGKVRAGDAGTTFNYTGQRRAATGLLFARTGSRPGLRSAVKDVVDYWYSYATQEVRGAVQHTVKCRHVAAVLTVQGQRATAR